MAEYYAKFTLDCARHVLYMAHYIHILVVQGACLLPSTVLLPFQIRRAAIELRTRIEAHVNYLR